MKLLKTIKFILAECSYGQKQYGVHLGPLKLITKLENIKQEKYNYDLVKKEYESLINQNMKPFKSKKKYYG